LLCAGTGRRPSVAFLLLPSLPRLLPPNLSFLSFRPLPLYPAVLPAAFHYSFGCIRTRRPTAVTRGSATLLCGNRKRARRRAAWVVSRAVSGGVRRAAAGGGSLSLVAQTASPVSGLTVPWRPAGYGRNVSALAPSVLCTTPGRLPADCQLDASAAPPQHLYLAPASTPAPVVGPAQRYTTYLADACPLRFFHATPTFSVGASCAWLAIRRRIWLLLSAVLNDLLRHAATAPTFGAWSYDYSRASASLPLALLCCALCVPLPSFGRRPHCLLRPSSFSTAETFTGAYRTACAGGDYWLARVPLLALLHLRFLSCHPFPACLQPRALTPHLLARTCFLFSASALIRFLLVGACAAWAVAVARCVAWASTSTYILHWRILVPALSLPRALLFSMPSLLPSLWIMYWRFW